MDKEIPDEIIRKLIDAARHAPSSRDSQPWEFVIVKDNEIKEKLAELKGEGNKEHILGAGVIIVVGVDKKKSETRWVEDGVCAAMNILLEAHNLGLGAVYVTGYSNTEPKMIIEIQKVLNLPEDIIPVVLIPLGYPDPSEKIEKKELREIDELTHFDRW